MTQQTILFTSQLLLRQTLLGGGDFENGSMLWPKRQPPASLAVWQIQQDAPARPVSPPSQTSSGAGPQVACQSCPGSAKCIVSVSLLWCLMWKMLLCGVFAHLLVRLVGLGCRYCLLLAVQRDEEGPSWWGASFQETEWAIWQHDSVFCYNWKMQHFFIPFYQ